MTPDKRERAIKYLTEEIRSLRMAPQINGCGPENWEEQLEVMETCLEAVRDYHPAHIDREAWTAEWVDNDKSEEMMCKCSKCGYPVSYFWGKTEICPGCGRAMTPEAWEELEKRLRG